MVDDCCLYVFCLGRCPCMSVIGMSCVICECGDDHDVITLECGLFDCVECLREGECHVGLYVELGVVFADAIDAALEFAGGEVFKVAVVEDVRRGLRGRRRTTGRNGTRSRRNRLTPGWDCGLGSRSDCQSFFLSYFLSLFFRDVGSQNLVR